MNVIRTVLVLTVCFFMAACSATTGDGNDGKKETAADHPEMDWMEIIPDPPEGGYQIQTPIYPIPPYSEIYNCVVGTWPHDMGVHWFEWFHDPVIGHHMRMDKVGDVGGFKDGEVVDCRTPALMGNAKPYFNATEPGLVTGRMNLEEGMGVVVKGGDRWVIQSHHINLSGKEVWVQDTVNIGWTPLEDLDKPLSTWTFDNVHFELPPNQISDIVFKCTWPQDINVVMWMVHMHDRALSFTAEVQQEDRSWKTWFDVPKWDPKWYLNPDLKLPADPVQFKKGQIVRGTCRINNNTDEARIWPEEMCVVEGLAYPLYEGLTERFMCGGEEAVDPSAGEAVSCDTDADCTGDNCTAAPSFGCKCFAIPGSDSGDSICVPLCEQDADCPQIGLELVCGNGTCAPPNIGPNGTPGDPQNPPVGEPLACETDADCSGENCTADPELGCKCFAVPGLNKSICVPLCEQDVDCPQLGIELICKGGMCGPPNPGGP